MKKIPQVFRHSGKLPQRAAAAGPEQGAPAKRAAIRRQAPAWTAVWFLLSLAAGFVPPVRAAAGAAAERIWFRDIRQGLPLSSSQMTAVARQVFDAARKARCPRDFLSEFGADTLPRIVFVTIAWEPGVRPAPHARKKSGSPPAPPAGHVYCGSGFGLAAAMRDALDRAFAAKKKLRYGKARAVKVDIVQYSSRPAGFLVRKDTVTYPGLAGLAFGPHSRIAFLPEQLLAGVYLDAKGMLRIHRIEEVLALERNFQSLGLWSGLASFTIPQGVRRFECSSAWADARETAPLFRGHRLAASAPPALLRKAAETLARRLMRAQTPAGRILIQAPGWVESMDDARPLQPQAAATYALLRLSGAVDSPDIAARLRRTANAMLERLLRRFQTAPRTAGAKAVAEVDRFRVETNALVALALIERYHHSHDAADLTRILEIGRFLLAQLQPDGSMVLERYADSGNIRATPESPAISGLAVLALTRLYETTGYPICLNTAAAAMNYILKTWFLKTEMAKLPLNDDLACAINELFTFTRDSRLLEQAERLGLAILAKQDRDPATLDLLGSAFDDPSATAAAARCRALLALASILDDNRRTEAAAKLLSAAHLTLIYLMNLRFTPTELLYVEHPDNYAGLFREDASAFQCTFPAQFRTLLALTAALEWSRDHHGGSLPLSKADAGLLEKMRDRLRRFPRVLNRLPNVSSLSAGPTGAGDEGIPVINAIPKTRP